MAKAVYAIIDDDTLESKIRQSTDKLNLDLFVIKDINDLNEKIYEKIPRVIIIDLLSEDIAVESFINIIRDTNRLKYSFLIGFTPSVDTNSMSKLIAGKCNMVVSKAKFLRELDQLIKRNL